MCDMCRRVECTFSSCSTRTRRLECACLSSYSSNASPFRGHTVGNQLRFYVRDSIILREHITVYWILSLPLKIVLKVFINCIIPWLTLYLVALLMPFALYWAVCTKHYALHCTTSLFIEFCYCVFTVNCCNGWPALMGHVPFWQPS